MIKSRWVSLLVWMTVVPFAAWAVLRIGGWTPVWQWIALVAFTPYVAAASAAALLLALGLRRWGAAAVALVASVALAVTVLPRHFGDGDQPVADGGLRVLAGDFNATLDHSLVGDLLGSGYHDAADATGNGLTATWPQQGWKPVPGVTIDHVLADSRMAIRAFGVHALPDTDHRPVFAELGLPRLASR
jgi:endonuclease/exonuclease/phosphatase family metal-dependent hydrolase